MAQDFDDNDDYDDDQDGSHVTLSRQQIRAMERDAKAARKTAEEADQLRRELALARAGASDLSERQQRALLASIDGDVTPDAIRAAAEELGFMAPSAASAGAEEQGATDRIAAASAGSPESSDEDPIARLHRADREGGQAAVLAELQRNGRTIVTAS